MPRKIVENHVPPTPPECPACTQAVWPVPEPVGLVGQTPKGLCGWCGGTGKLSTRTLQLYEQAAEKMRAALAPTVLVEPEGAP